jgi:hypothetical protein
VATYLLRPAAREYLKDVHGIELGVSALENKASDGTGPVYAKINGRALYKRADLDAWVAAEATKPAIRRRQSIATTDSRP